MSATLLEKYDFNGFPVVRGTQLVGFATREKIKAVLGELDNSLLRDIIHEDTGILSSDDLSDNARKCSFSRRESVLPEADKIDFSASLEEAILQLRKDVPQELVINMFQKLVSSADSSMMHTCLYSTESAPNTIHAIW